MPTMENESSWADHDNSHVTTARFCNGYGNRNTFAGANGSNGVLEEDSITNGVEHISPVIVSGCCRKRKLILHFDVRNTILVFDSVTHDDVEQALNSFLTGVTWGRLEEAEGEGDRWVWYSDKPSLTAPSPGTITYYKSRERELVRSPNDRVLLRRATGDFTRQPIGNRFRSHFDKHLKLLEWNFGPDTVTVVKKNSHQIINGAVVTATTAGSDFTSEDEVDGGSICETGSSLKPKVDRQLTIMSADGRLYHYLLPSFVKLLYDLTADGRQFAVILRTYGVDAPKVLESIEHIVAGHHPQFPRRIPIHVRRTPGNIYRAEGEQIRVEVPPTTHCRPHRQPEVGGDVTLPLPEVYETDADIYRMLSEAEGVCGFVDDFNWWQSGGYSHVCGKPFWLDPYDPDVQHIFFDDNLRVTDVDSIVDVRLFDEGSRSPGSTSGLARSLALDEIGELENVCLVQADLLACTSHVDYFRDKIRDCEKNYEAWLEVRKNRRNKTK